MGKPCLGLRKHVYQELRSQSHVSVHCHENRPQQASRAARGYPFLACFDGGTDALKRFADAHQEGRCASPTSWLRVDVCQREMYLLFGRNIGDINVWPLTPQKAFS